MRHQCTVCLRAFVDDSEIPASGRVHCVYCGASIAANRRRRRQDRAGALPFSKEAPREETFALGIIGSGPVGFPDTLRQFRVRPTTTPRTDTLMPVAHGTDQEAPSEDGHSPAWRMRSFWLSLSAGLLVGVAVASVATSSSRNRSTPTAGARSVAPAALPAGSVSTASTPAVPLPACSAAAPSSASPPKVSAPAKPYDAGAERRFLLDRARARQREYRLGDAERLYRQVLARAPRDSEALSGLGEVDVLRGVDASADRHFQEALRVNGDYVPALIAVADLKWQSGRLEEAQQDYRRIVESYADDLYPPYVAQRGSAPLPPQCAEK